MANTDSILDTTKKLLGLESDYTPFDLDVITHINSVFFELQQLGVGPADGFSITDNTANWSEFTDGQMINSVKSFMYTKVRLLFDPPASSFALESMSKQADQMAWRLNIQQEGVRHPNG